jgi:hypothetical protein
MSSEFLVLGLICANFVAVSLAGNGQLGFMGSPGLPALRGPLRSIAVPRHKRSAIVPVWRSPSRLGPLHTIRKMHADAVPREESVGRQVPSNVEAIFDESNTFEANELVVIKKADGSR